MEYEGEEDAVGVQSGLARLEFLDALEGVIWRALLLRLVGDIERVVVVLVIRGMDVEPIFRVHEGAKVVTDPVLGIEYLP